MADQAKIADAFLVEALINIIRMADADELAVVIPQLIVGVTHAEWDEETETWTLEFENKGMRAMQQSLIDGLKQEVADV